MGIERHKTEEIVAKLRQVEVLCGQGMPRVDAIRQVKITEQTFYHQRKQFAGRRDPMTLANGALNGAMYHRTDDGKAFRTLNILDEHSRECLAIRVKMRLNSTEVFDALTDLFILRGALAFIRADSGPEFIAQAVRDWIVAVGAKTAYIEPGSPRKNGYCESFSARLRDEMLNGEVFYNLREARTLIEKGRKHYKTKRTHSALGYRPPPPETIILMEPRPIMH